MWPRWVSMTSQVAERGACDHVVGGDLLPPWGMQYPRRPERLAFHGAVPECTALVPTAPITAPVASNLRAWWWLIGGLQASDLRLCDEPPIGIEPMTFSLRDKTQGSTRLHRSPLNCGYALNERPYDALVAVATATELHRACVREAGVAHGAVLSDCTAAVSLSIRVPVCVGDAVTRRQPRDRRSSDASGIPRRPTSRGWPRRLLRSRRWPGRRDRGSRVHLRGAGRARTTRQ